MKLLLCFCLFCLFYTTSGWFNVLHRSSYKTATTNANNTPNEDGVTLNILNALKLNNNMRGVIEVPGLYPNISAWRFHTAFDQAQVPLTVVSDVLSHWPHANRNDGNISLHFVVRQHKKTIATLISINSPGKMSPWFRVTSNLKSGPQLILFYHITEDEKLHQAVFDLPHLQNWSQILLSISGDESILFIDCEPPRNQVLLGHINLDFPKDALIYFRQEPGFKKKFLGAVQIAKMSSIPIPQRPWSCYEN